MLDDGVADGAAASRHDVEVLARQPALVDEQGGELDGAERRLRGRLEDDRAAGGDRRGELVGDEVEWKVERRDRPDHADRDTHRESHLALPRRDGVEGDELAGEGARLGGRELERPDGALRLDPRRADRLGRLGGDRPGKVLLALGEQAGGRVEDLRPLPPRQAAAVQRLLRRCHGTVDVRSGGQRHAADL